HLDWLHAGGQAGDAGHARAHFVSHGVDIDAGIDGDVHPARAFHRARAHPIDVVEIGGHLLDADDDLAFHVFRARARPDRLHEHGVAGAGGEEFLLHPVERHDACDDAEQHQQIAGDGVASPPGDEAFQHGSVSKLRMRAALNESRISSFSSPAAGAAAGAASASPARSIAVTAMPWRGLVNTETTTRSPSATPSRNSTSSAVVCAGRTWRTSIVLSAVTTYTNSLRFSALR